MTTNAWDEGKVVGSPAPVDPAAALEELERILASPQFKGSKRCSKLLKHIGTAVLTGHSDDLKERTIGVAVFGREPDYETGSDPIVRSAAVEVRKHIALYYQQFGQADRIRITLPSGSYAPVFTTPKDAKDDPARVGVTPASGDSLDAPAQTGIGPTRRQWISLVCASLILIVTAAATWALWARQVKEPIDLFWAPVLENASTVTLALGNSRGTVPLQAAITKESSILDVIQSDHVGYIDAMVMARLTAFLTSHGKQVETRRDGALALGDLRKAPAVLVGGINSSWLRVLTGGLRFSIEWNPATGVGGILDRQNPQTLLGQTLATMPYSALKEDFAVITRIVDRRVEQTVILVAGLGRDGTQAAGEFITNPKYLSSLAARAPADWRQKNIQVVIATELVNGSSGPPRIVAAHFW